MKLRYPIAILYVLACIPIIMVCDHAMDLYWSGQILLSLAWFAVASMFTVGLACVGAGMFVQLVDIKPKGIEYV